MFKKKWQTSFEIVKCASHMTPTYTRLHPVNEHLKSTKSTQFFSWNKTQTKPSTSALKIIWIFTESYVKQPATSVGFSMYQINTMCVCRTASTFKKDQILIKKCIYKDQGDVRFLLVLNLCQLVEGYLSWDW